MLLTDKAPCKSIVWTDKSQSPTDNDIMREAELTMSQKIIKQAHKEQNSAVRQVYWLWIHILLISLLTNTPKFYYELRIPIP